jgi:2-polyprenyl-3-methyl-5-hydroxy-6-metoxy-1,4-benzoquinol methylase
LSSEFSGARTKDPVNQCTIEAAETYGIDRLGLMTGQVWTDDPRRLLFSMSRYKFVAKMLEGTDKVLEVGCGDGFCARVVAQTVGQLSITDYDPVFIADATARAHKKWPINAFVHDMLASPLTGGYDAMYSLDVLEHIPAEMEDTFLNNAKAALSGTGTMIVGIPSLESQAFASPPSRAGHVNCKTMTDFRTLMQKHFQTVFMFSMNDEVVHTGFAKMAHYLIAVCVNKKA